MLSLFLVTLGLATIGAHAKPTIRAASGLELWLSTPADKVAFASDLRVISTVKNVGSEGLKILKLGTVLDTEHPTHAFTVTKDGKEVPFNLTRVTPPSDHLCESDWVVIRAGENVTSEHNVSALYDFSGSGLGTFTFDPVSRFEVIGLNDTVDTTSGAIPIVVADAHPVSITITNDASKRELKLEKRELIRIGCDATSVRYPFVRDSVIEAQSMAGTARTYIENNHSDQLFKDYFGTNSEQTVMDRFTLIFRADRGYPQMTLHCEADEKSCGGRIAYYNDAGGHYCNAFWDQKGVKGIKDFCKDSSDYVYRGGTTLRMLAAIFNGADDHYPRLACDKAITFDNHQKIITARNYECFAMEAIRRTWCK